MIRPGEIARTAAITAAGVVGLAAGGVAAAEEIDLEAEVRALRAEVRALRGEQHADWLDERRREEVRALVADVLHDAQTRRSFAEGSGLTAGHDGNFFLASDDGNFRLNLGGQIQFRYIANFRNSPDVGNETESGFQHRRTRLNFTGHVFDPRLTFQIQPEVSRDGGGLGIANLNFGYQLTDSLDLTVGRKKAPFLKEELHSSSRQLAVERSSFNNAFTGARTTGVELRYGGEQLRAYGQVNNGFGTRPQRFDDDDNTARVGLTGRAEALIAGDWNQYRDFVAWSGQPLGIILGAGGHYENNRTNRFGGAYANTLDFASWTVDAALYYEQFSAFAAFAGRHDVRGVEGPGGEERYDDYGLLVQGAYNIDDRIAPFVRYEWLMPDSGRETHDIHLITAGVNYYFHGHAAKLTTDVVWGLNSLSGFYTGSEALGLLPDAPGEKNQVAIRAQFQLLF